MGKKHLPLTKTAKKPSQTEQTEKAKKKLLEELETYPIVEIACKRAGVGRATYYDWRKRDRKFAISADDALGNGVKFVNDLAESKLLKKMQEENLTAIIYWLKHHHASYNDKMLHRHEFDIAPDLTPEQEKELGKAIELAGMENVLYLNKKREQAFLESGDE